MKLTKSIHLIVFISAILFAQEPWEKQAQEQNLPSWVRDSFLKNGLIQTYSISYYINPFYLRGDFNGDQKSDIAVLIEKKSSSERGIAIFHSNDSVVFILGAGKKIGNGGSDFKWMNIWSVYPKSAVSFGVGETSIPSLKGEALHLVKLGSASGIVYWTGQKYVWYQQGD